MCFSAGGSLTLSAVLTGVGATALARNSSPPYQLFAAVPLLFAAQQAAEAIVWLTIDMPSEAALYHRAVLAFLAGALVVWPVWSPLSLRLVEQDPRRQRMLTALCWFGAVVAVGGLLSLVRTLPIARMTGRSLSYEYRGAAHGLGHALVLAAYITSTIIPFFVSTARLVRTIGVTLVVSVVITAILREGTLTSVWCFFAAINSCLIVAAVPGGQRDVLTSRPTRARLDVPAFAELRASSIDPDIR